MDWFWKGKKPESAQPPSSSGSPPRAKDPVQPSAHSAPAAPSSAPPDRAAIRAQALENARKARAVIGEETLQKIAAALQKKQESDMEKARNRIKSMDSGRVADNIKAMMEGKKTD